MDWRNLNVSTDLSAILQVPTVDAPVAALLPHTAVPGAPDEGLHPEERRAEQVL